MRNPVLELEEMRQNRERLRSPLTNERTSSHRIHPPRNSDWGLSISLPAPVLSLIYSRLVVAGQGRSSGGWARLPGRDRGPFRPGGLIALGDGLATSCL